MRILLLRACAFWVALAILVPASWGHRRIAIVISALLGGAAVTLPKRAALSDGWVRYSRRVPLPWAMLSVAVMPGLAIGAVSGDARPHRHDLLRQRATRNTLYIRERRHKRRAVIVPPSGPLAPWFVDPAFPVRIAEGSSFRDSRQFLLDEAQGQLLVAPGAYAIAIRAAIATGASVVYGVQLLRDGKTLLVNHGVFTPGMHLAPRTTSTDVSILPHLSGSETEIEAMLQRDIAAAHKRLSHYAQAFGV